MIYDSARRWYTAKDIKGILNITPGQLFHWGRTWGLIQPEVKAKGRQGKDQYSFKNLLFLSLLKELLNYGINLGDIKELFNTKIKGKSGNKEIIFNDIFDYYKNTFPSYPSKFYLVILTEDQKEGKMYYWKMIEKIDEKNILHSDKLPNKNFISSLVIDIKSLIASMEILTGEEFDI